MHTHFKFYKKKNLILNFEYFLFLVGFPNDKSPRIYEIQKNIISFSKVTMQTRHQKNLHTKIREKEKLHAFYKRTLLQNKLQSLALMIFPFEEIHCRISIAQKKIRRFFFSEQKNICGEKYTFFKRKLFDYTQSMCNICTNISVVWKWPKIVLSVWILKSACFLCPVSWMYQV